MSRRWRWWSAALALAIVAAAGASLRAWRARAPGGDAPAAAPDAAVGPLGVYGRVPEFSLLERSGRIVTLADLSARVWVANFIDTQCTETCPTQSLELSRLQRGFVNEPDLRLVSITVDPDHDTPAVLARYAERYRADPERRLFLTGPRRAIYALARDGFKLGVVDPGEPQEASGLLRRLGPRSADAAHGSTGLIMHSPRLVLVDRQQRIRAYHRADDPESLARLREQVRALLAGRRGEGSGAGRGTPGGSPGPGG